MSAPRDPADDQASAQADVDLRMMRRALALAAGAL